MPLILYNIRDCWAVGWGHNVAQPEGTHVESSEARLPEHADNQAMPDEQESVNICGMLLLVLAYFQQSLDLV